MRDLDCIKDILDVNGFELVYIEKGKNALFQPSKKCKDFEEIWIPLASIEIEQSSEENCKKDFRNTIIQWISNIKAVSGEYFETNRNLMVVADGTALGPVLKDGKYYSYILMGMGSI